MSHTGVITGANRGIGLALASLYSAQGQNVFALCRHSSAELAALNVNVVTDIDVATDAGITNMKQALANACIDLLICNAGILRDESLANLNLDTIRAQFEVNAVAPLRVVEALQNQLTHGAKWR